MTREIYVNLEAGRRHLYASDLLKLYFSHGITPNEILLSAQESAEFFELAGMQPPTITARSLILRYLKLPTEMRNVIDRLADALYRADVALTNADRH